MAEVDFSLYPLQNKYDLRVVLARIATDIARLQAELGSMRKDELTSRMSAWIEGQGMGVTERQEFSRANSYVSKGAILELEGELAALIEERDLVRILLGNGSV